MTPFEAFLQQNKIQASSFKRTLLQEWEAMEREFGAMGEKSFEKRKRFLLNNLRLEFPLEDEVSARE
ncbi:MAG: hypothetical protein AAF570_13865 [Bacteroidota bacterium]